MAPARCIHRRASCGWRVWGFDFSSGTCSPLTMPVRISFAAIGRARGGVQGGTGGRWRYEDACVDWVRLCMYMYLCLLHLCLPHVLHVSVFLVLSLAARLSVHTCFLHIFFQQRHRTVHFAGGLWTPSLDGGGVCCRACALSICLCPYASAWRGKRPVSCLSGLP